MWAAMERASTAGATHTAHVVKTQFRTDEEQGYSVAQYILHIPDGVHCFTEPLLDVRGLKVLKGDKLCMWFRHSNQIDPPAECMEMIKNTKKRKQVFHPEWKRLAKVWGYASTDRRNKKRQCTQQTDN